MEERSSTLELRFLFLNKFMIYTIQSIIIYPIKGMTGVNMSSVKALERGFENDRRYMLVDENNTFISQRTHPILTQIKPTIVDEEIHVEFKGIKISIPLSQKSSVSVNAILFGNKVQGTLVSDEVDDYFSKIVGEPVRLVKMTEADVRKKQLVRGPESTEVSFADGYPFLIAGTESLATLNTKLDNPVLMDRFRPNIVVHTDEAHIEDTWENIEIGSCKFMIIKPCARCPVVTIDQASGLRSKEPLKTLSTYRKIGNNVYFGANAICLSEGEVRIGDNLVPR